MPTLQPDFFDHQPGPLPDGHAGTRPAWLADLARRIGQDWEALRSLGEQPRHHLSQTATYVLAEAVAWMQALPDGCIHAIVTDPPYGLIEYNGKNQEKLRAGRGGVWRIPPSFDGAKRRALPRFTVLSKEDTSALQAFFHAFAENALRILAPGGATRPPRLR
jgi:site-specific DNA-methyltransferase (adenine-specific)